MQWVQYLVRRSLLWQGEESLRFDFRLPPQCKWDPPSSGAGSCRQPQTYVKPEAEITVFELLLMSGVSLETCWAIEKHWNNKFYYTVASCWLFLYDLYYVADPCTSSLSVEFSRDKQSFKTGPNVCPEASVTTNRRCVTSQKTEDLERIFCPPKLWCPLSLLFNG